MAAGKPILCLDWDGVIHSYTSGWKGATVIPDPPVPGAIAFIIAALDHFSVQIFSSRSHEAGGRQAMYRALLVWMQEEGRTREEIDRVCDEVDYPDNKPPAKVTIDDRAIQFDGTWPDIEMLKAFKPWNMK